MYRVRLGRRWPLNPNPQSDIARGVVYVYIPVYIFELQRRCAARPRISLEETTPLHKQRNCGGVRASVASASLRVNGSESERVAFITIVTKRLHPRRRGGGATKEEIFPSPCVREGLGFSVPSFTRMRTRVRGHVHACACTAYTRRSTIFSRGANMRTHTPLAPYVPAYRALLVPTENFNGGTGGAKFSCAC